MHSCMVVGFMQFQCCSSLTTIAEVTGRLLHNFPFASHADVDVDRHDCYKYISFKFYPSSDLLISHAITYHMPKASK